MSTAILKAEVQSRIDALIYPITAKLLLKHAVETVGLGQMDFINIIGVLNSSTAAITVGTSDADIVALNATSIALGVTAKPVPSIIKSIQRGNTSAQSTVILSSVNMAKTRVNLLTTISVGGGGLLTASLLLISSTELLISSISDIINVSWEVIEYV